MSAISPDVDAARSPRNTDPFLHRRLYRFLVAQRDAMRSPEDRFRLMHSLIAKGLDCLPPPGAGRTLQRWQALAEVAAVDLSLVKFFEGHTDALEILRELHAPAPPPGSFWAVWAAESPAFRVDATVSGDGQVRLNGTKAWCSGAGGVTHALMTAWAKDSKPVLTAVALERPGVTVERHSWHAVGMAPTVSSHVVFDDCTALPIGAAGDYVARPGFWHGGAGIAACWYGAAVAIAASAREYARRRNDPHASAHLGAIDAEMTGAAAALRETAAKLDDEPSRDFQCDALRVRAVVENAAEAVLRHAGRALGAGAFCSDAAFARLAADLPVFLRQSHAERDLAVLGDQVMRMSVDPWSL
jgi:alkylation response protein AidB-like acyl-CoA dehydrogenase